MKLPDFTIFKPFNENREKMRALLPDKALPPPPPKRRPAPPPPDAAAAPAESAAPQQPQPQPQGAGVRYRSLEALPLSAALRWRLDVLTGLLIALILLLVVNMWMVSRIGMGGIRAPRIGYSKGGFTLEYRNRPEMGEYPQPVLVPKNAPVAAPPPAPGDR